MIWYKFETTSGVYFSPFTSSLRKVKHFESPVDLASFINSQDNYCEVITNNLIEMYDKSTPDSSPIDLPKGIYSYESSTNSSPERLVCMTVREDNYIDILDSLTDLDKSIEDFINNKHIYDESCSAYKLGVLMFGPPGTGKTSYLRQFIKSKEAICIFMDQIPTRKFLEKLESSTKDVLKIVIFEEAVSLLEDSFDIRQMLDFLDGSKSITNTIYFLSTNYPESIPENVIRNGRIDIFVKVEYPDVEARKKLIKLYLNKEASEEELKCTENMPIVDIREICFQHRKTSKNFKECVKIVEEKNKLLKKHFGRTREIRL